jgi:hypothetical protein
MSPNALADYGHLLAPHATRSRQILDAIWDRFGRNLDASSTAFEAPDQPILLNQAEHSEAL